MGRRRLAAAGTVLAALTLASACSSSGSAGASGGVRVVASTDVWGDVVRQVAGARAGHGVSITSIITDPSADPHSYEANSRTQLAVSRADLVVENGGGYDDFVGTLRSSSGTRAAVLDAVHISGGRAGAGGDVNEHVWYDFPTVRRVADRVATALGRLDRAHADGYRANARAFDGRLATLERGEAAIAKAHHGAGVAVTEPVPLYLLTACGLVDRTPPAFSKAVEEGDDVSAGVLDRTVALFAKHRVALLADNEQTSAVATERVRSAARDRHVPVVGVTETLPAGQDYLTWMTGNLAAVRRALG